MIKKKMSVFLLVMMNLATILSVRNWPFMAEYGFSSIIFFLLSILIFFIPVSLVSAELASGWPEKGGIFGWVEEAFNEKVGFLAVWLLWIENVVWYPTVFAFIVSTLSYALSPALAQNAFYNVSISLILFWLALCANFLGMRFSGWLSAVAVIFGTFIPGLIIILFGSVGALLGHSSEITFSWAGLVPNLTGINQLAFLVSMSLSFAGMELNAIHANEVENPRRNYPYAIFISAALIFVFSVIGTISIGMIIPKGEISLITTVIESISRYLKPHGLGSLVPLLALLVALGSVGGVIAWLTGTSKNLLLAGSKGHLPLFLCRVNRHQVPVPLLLFQGIIASGMCLVFVTMPDINSGFWTLTVLATQLYLLMYILMFAAAIALRFKRPEVVGTYRIPGGKKTGMVLVGGIGLVGCVFSFGMGFIPPPHLSKQAIFVHESFLIVGCFFFCALPLALKKLSGNRSYKNGMA